MLEQGLVTMQQIRT